jgi:hypothetical protein
MAFAGLAFEGVTNLVVFGWLIRSPGWAFEVATSLGFIMLGMASAALLRALRGLSVPGMRLVLRLFALGWLLLGIAYIGSIHYLIHLYGESPHEVLSDVFVSNVLWLTGYCATAAGFLMASLTVPSTTGDGGPPGELEPVAPLTHA